MIYVTHDQVEAMTLADRIVVLSAGRIEQIGTPLERYEHPANRFVAGFIGSPRMNFIAASAISGDANSTVVKLANGELIRCAVDGSVIQVGDNLTLGVRPEHLQIGGVKNAIVAAVTFVESLGSSTPAYCTFSGAEEALTSELGGRSRVRVGEQLALTIPADAAYLFDAAGQALRRNSADT
jgi:multiple sugar transport system ATP-binding protein